MLKWGFLSWQSDPDNVIAGKWLVRVHSEISLDGMYLAYPPSQWPDIVNVALDTTVVMEMTAGDFDALIDNKKIWIHWKPDTQYAMQLKDLTWPLR